MLSEVIPEVIPEVISGVTPPAVDKTSDGLTKSHDDLTDRERSSKRRKLEDKNMLVLRPNDMVNKVNKVLELDRGHEFYDFLGRITNVFVAQGTDSNEQKRKVFEAQAVIDKNTDQLNETEAVLAATKDTIVSITNENRLLKEEINRNKSMADDRNRQRAEQVNIMVADFETRVQAATDAMQSEATTLSETYHTDMVRLMTRATTAIQAMHVDICGRFNEFAHEIDEKEKK